MARTRSSRRPAPAPRSETVGAAFVVYVHGICRHDIGYSDPWWAALHPHLDDWPTDHRREVLWSDLVNPPEPETLRHPRPLSPTTLELLHPGAVAEADSEPILQIRDILADRVARQAIEATLQTAEVERAATAEAPRRPMPLARTVTPEALLGIPGLNCLDDFGVYLTDAATRQQVIDRFRDVVRPLLQDGAVLNIISHSWGTVVAYEGLCQSEGEESLPAHSVNTFFTVGSALSIAPVRRRLLPQAADGHRSRLVKTWVNLNARFDIVGGAIQGMPFEVDFEFLGLDPVGCSRIIPNSACAHGSYFHPDNLAVNRDIFGRFIQP